MRLLVSAVDASADRFAAAAVSALRAGGSVEAFGLGRDALAREGVRLLARGEALAAVGFMEAVPRSGAAVLAWTRAGARLLAGAADVALVADAPALHLPLLAIARRARVPSVYYLPPQAWAWWEERARTIARTGARLCVALPFEEAWWRARGAEASFVGHPLLDDLVPARRAERGVCAVLPGSRREEFSRMLAPMVAAARIAGFRPLVGLAPGVAPPRDVESAPGAEAIARAEAAIAKSGTVALEAALAGLPTVIAYRVSAASFALARRLVRVPHVGLPNLVLGRRAYPELMQDAATADGLARALGSIAARDFAPEADELRARLGPPGAAQRVADAVREAARARAK